MTDLTDEELVQGMLEGLSLRTFMIPDPAMPRNHPEHMESYDLPHVVINGNNFWGKSESAHLLHFSGEKQTELIPFCYTNAAEVFCLFTPAHGRGAYMRKDRYKSGICSTNTSWPRIRAGSGRGMAQ